MHFTIKISETIGLYPGVLYLTLKTEKICFVGESEDERWCDICTGFGGNEKDVYLKVISP